MKASNFKIPALLAVSAVMAALLLAAACGGGVESVTRAATLSQPPPEESPPSASSAPTAVQESPNESVVAGTQESEELPAYPAGQALRRAVGDKGPEFIEVSNWINSEPLTMASLQGSVVLIDFWTYTCINCIRTIPYLREWQAKYADKGLIIIGVHTPEFEFEKITENVERSAAYYSIDWAIAQDNDFIIWRTYNNRAWPSKYLIDRDGVIRYSHIGEGAYVDTERRIRDLLEENGADLSDVEISSAPDFRFDPQALSENPATRIAREIYGGYRRNNTANGIYVAHFEYYGAPRQTLVYEDPGNHDNQFIYLQGLWTNGIEQLRHARETQNYEDYIAFRFFASSVNAVLNPEGGDPFEVQVTIDDRPLAATEVGTDVVIEDERSFFRVDEGRLYEVVALPEFGGHDLKLSSNSPDFALFALTFGAYSEVP